MCGWSRSQNDHRIHIQHAQYQAVTGPLFDAGQAPLDSLRFSLLISARKIKVSLGIQVQTCQLAEFSARQDGEEDFRLI